VNFQFSKGFSLIELLVVTAIIMVVTGFGLAGWTKFREKSLINSAAAGLKTELRLVRSQAINGKKPTSGCLTFDGYQIDSSLVVRACCDGSCNGSTRAIEVNPAIDLTFSAEFPIMFHALSGRIDDAASITLSYHDDQAIININSSGEIE